MYGTLACHSWIGVRAGCDMTYCISTDEDVDIMLSDGARRFEFAIETEALRKLLEVGGRALAELDALAEREGARRDGREPAELAAPERSA